VYAIPPLISRTSTPASLRLLGVLRKNAKIELIKRVPLFAHCSKKELGLVAQIADEIDLTEGKTLMREGDRGREFFVLVEGSADVRRRNRKVNTLGGGDFFGEIALVSQRPRTATVTTTSPVRALVVTEQSFRSLLDRAPDVQRKVLQALADRVAADSI
jgi:CRP/FNR family transcriptional regulator, cyclic AMP receptor protein